MPDNNDLADTVIMLFDSAIETGHGAAMKPNAMLMLPPETLVEGAEESKAHQSFVRSVKMRAVVHAFRSRSSTPDQAVMEMAEDIALWSMVGGYVWARDHDVSALNDMIIHAKPLEEGLDKWTPEECKVLAAAGAKAIMDKFHSGPNGVASIAPFGGWNTGKKLYQFEKDGEILAALLQDGGDDA